MKVLMKVSRTIKTQIWWIIALAAMVVEVTSLSGPNVCMVKQKYNVTKRVKYRAPMSVRTYEWCFAMPPRCSKWNTEMRDVTRLETEERTADMAVCCPGYKLKDVSCVSICPNGKTGAGCSDECPPNKWGPNCVNECKQCEHGTCDPISGECRCQDGWQGESCETSLTPTAADVAMMEQLLTTVKSITSTKTTTQITPTVTTSTTISTTTRGTSIPTTVATLTSTEKIQMTIPSTTISPTTKREEEMRITLATTTQNSKVLFKNETISTLPTKVNTYKLISEVETNNYSSNNSIYKGTELPEITTEVIPTTKAVLAGKSTKVKQFVKDSTLPNTDRPNTVAIVTQIPKTTAQTSTLKATTKETLKPETTKKPETTIKQPTTTKFKPKEIWIKPAQKGESQLTESKTKSNQEQPYSKSRAKEVSEVTTPKTIIVSIIPTSVSYITFKKIALTTASAMSQKNKATLKTHYTSADRESTIPMTIHTTSTPFTVKVLSKTAGISSTINPLLLPTVSKAKFQTASTKRTPPTTLPTNQTTNSMSSTLNAAKKPLNSSLLTVSLFLTNASSTQRLHNVSTETSTRSYVTAPHTKQAHFTAKKTATNRSSVTRKIATGTQENGTMKPMTSQTIGPPNITKTFVGKQTDTNSQRNLTISYTKTNTVTDDPTLDEETFHILTEPEHITAVMGDKGTERSNYNLISVISIAGGVMMAIITVAVVIVMLERCRRPTYEDVRKFNDMRMQVMIDNNDIPPPYVRSIFHTPLPDPPTVEKCHYQPISTLDRNLKQFMRPVVVQTISPLMLENFRGILECHYDHLPRRSNDMSLQARCSVAPSHDDHVELIPHRAHSLTESDIEAMKCEAKMDVIDNTTSEPLYAEIPCWRPPSAHAIEVVNLNGEAVTEL